jgi:hypothetical protein
LSLEWLSRVERPVPRGVSIEETPGGFTIRWVLPLPGPTALAAWVGLVSLLSAGAALQRQLTPAGPQAPPGFLAGSIALFVGFGALALALWRLKRHGSLAVTPTHVIATGAGAAWRGKVLVSALNAVVRSERIAGRVLRGDVDSVTRFFGRYTTEGSSAEEDMVLVPTLTAVNKRLERTVLFRTLPSEALGHWLEEVMYAWLEHRRSRAPRPTDARDAVRSAR